MDDKLNLDVDAPDKVTEVLGRAIGAYLESSSELESAWQDKGAGKPWVIIAQELDKTISRIDKRLKKEGY